MSPTTTTLGAIVLLIAINQVIVKMPFMRRQQWLFWTIQIANLAIALVVLTVGLPGLVSAARWIVGALFLFHLVQNLQTRTHWFNPSRAGRPMYPHVKMLQNYARAAIEADVPVFDKIACLAMLVPWSIRNRLPLWWDFAFALSYAMVSRKRTSAQPGS